VLAEIIARGKNVAGIAMPTKTVIISSTGTDLKEYREAAEEICHRVRLFPVAMEYFEAMDAGATEGSKRKVDEADVYVGIYAHRYGYIEPGYDKSVTEVEFDYAGQRKIERLCFVIDPQVPWPPDAIDYKNHERLEQFKSRLTSTMIRGQFTTIDDLRVKLMQALVEWKARHGDIDSRGADDAASRPPQRLAPPQPALVVGRENDFVNVKARLGIGSGNERRAVTVIRGWPGVGKTTFVNALAHDAEIAAAFPDGVLWAVVGQSPNPVGELLGWARTLGAGEIREAHSLENVINRVRALLQGRQALLIVDDVWDVDAGAAFKVAGPRCATVFTSRLPEVAVQLAPTRDDVYLLGQLDEAKGLELFSRLAPNVAEAYPAECRKLVNDLEGLPLAIRVAARLVASEAELGWDMRAFMSELGSSARLLQQAAPDDRLDPRTGTIPTFSVVLKQSTARLDEETRERFAYLGAFAPKPATFDMEAMQAVWVAPDFDNTRATVRTLAGRGLLEPIIGTGRFQMHAVLVLHAQSLLAT
jgi:uncharacterized protein DUF4062/NB-ARC domain-containing protein